MCPWQPRTQAYPTDLPPRTRPTRDAVLALASFLAREHASVLKHIDAENRRQAILRARSTSDKWCGNVIPWASAPSLSCHLSPRQITALRVNNIPTASPQAVIEATTMHFSAVFGNTATGDGPAVQHAFRCLPPLNPYTIPELPFSPQELDAVLDTLPKHKSPGADGVTYEALAALSQQARLALLAYLNDVITTASIPVEWRDRLTHPILKDGADPLKITSWRPITLVSTLSQVAWGLVLGRIAPVLAECLPSFLWGFIEDRSTLEPLYFQHIARAHPKIEVVTGDIAGAFDRLPHPLPARTWALLNLPFAPFLSASLKGNVTRVKTHWGYTPPIKLVSGVPQGGRESPLLFVLGTLPFFWYAHTHLPPPPGLPTAAPTYADDNANYTTCHAALVAVAEFLSYLLWSVGMPWKRTKTRAWASPSLSRVHTDEGCVAIPNTHPTLMPPSLGIPPLPSSFRLLLLWHHLERRP